MERGVKRLTGFLSYFFFAINHSFLAERRPMQRYYGRAFSGSALILSLSNCGNAVAAFLCLLHERELKDFSFAHLIDLATIAAAFFTALSQYCLMELGFGLSFLFLLLLESATILPMLLSKLVFTRERIRHRDVILSSFYSTGIAIFMVAKRGPFDYWTYFLVIGWLCCDALARFLQTKAVIYSRETRNADVVVSSLWGFIFSLTFACLNKEVSALPLFSALGDCFIVSLFQIGSTASLLYFFGRTPLVRLEALFGVSKVARILLSFGLYKWQVHFWESLAMWVVVSTRIAESLMRVLEAQKAQVFDHKKERDLTQSNYPPTTPAVKTNVKANPNYR